MTPKQLHALEIWLEAKIAQDDSIEDAIRVTQLRKEMLGTFGFAACPRTGKPLVELPPVKCERCFLERPASEADEACRGCGDNAEEAAKIDWRVVVHPNLIGGWYALQHVSGRYHMDKGNPKMVVPYCSRGAARAAGSRMFGKGAVKS